MYEQQRDDFRRKLERAEETLNREIDAIKDNVADECLKRVESSVCERYESFIIASKEYESFLSGMNTPESVKDIELHRQYSERVKYIFEEGQTHIYQLKAQANASSSSHAEVLSSLHSPNTQVNVKNVASLNGERRHSPAFSRGSQVSSRLSNISKISSLIAVKRARAEAAKARAQFAEREVALAKQKAGLEADLNLLAHQKEAAAAEAEVQALELAEDTQDGSVKSQIQRDFDPIHRTKEYVRQQSLFRDPNAFRHDSNENKHYSFQIGDHERNYHHTDQWRQNNHMFDFDVNRGMLQGSSPHRIFKPLNVEAPPYFPMPNNNAQKSGKQEDQNHQRTSEVTSELARFLLKKDLLLTRLTTFNDRPESYASWKSSFNSVMRELNVSYIEEIDLLVKWLGNESRQHAISIRAANTNDPARGVYRIWERLNERFGSPEMVEAALKNKLLKFPKLTMKDNAKLYELSDILSEIEAVKEDPKHISLLSYYDSSTGIIPIVNKLPYPIQEKWTTRASNYKTRYSVPFPPFSEFCNFMREISKIRNDPGFKYDTNATSSTAKERNGFKPMQVRPMISAKKTDVEDNQYQDFCPLHKKNHSLNKCRGFRAKPLDERKKILREHNVCFRCCSSNTHRARECKMPISCEDCGSDRHPSALHMNNSPNRQLSAYTSTDHGGEKLKEIKPTITPKCTQICGKENLYAGKSCAKLVLVNVYSRTNPGKSIKAYAILDEQSNRSLANTELFTLLDVHTEEVEYTLSSCSGTVVASGRRMSGCVVESLDGSTTLELPTLIECNQIPNVRDEIPTPEVAMHHPHLMDIAQHIPELDSEADILLLIGRDLIDAHHVFDQRVGPRNAPYAQRLSLGWVVIGEVCLGKVHAPDNVYVNKTYCLNDGRSSIFKPCPNDFTIREKFNDSSVGASLFVTMKDDNKPGMSIEDKEFLKIMEGEFSKHSCGNWVAPLPFKAQRPRLPNNRSQALKRAYMLNTNLQKNPLKKKHFTTFMQGIIESGHAELAPPVKKNEECWYLPIFGVYHPKKPEQIRGVFDSSAKHEGVSLNDVLLSGPDLTNSLLGILLRFRKEPVAITADIQQMFYCFLVREDHRNFLRFLWYLDNDPDKDLVDYRMCVHVFGNSPSPAIATYGLRKTAHNSEDMFGTDVREFVGQNFYVDDGLTSLPTCDEAIDLMRRTQKALSVEGNLRLHKIASNKHEVMKAFPSEGLSKDLKNLNLNKDSLPIQHSLGLNWNHESDTFTFQVSTEEKPYTRRGVLSTINSLYDPLGFLAPVTIQGKILLRDLMTDKTDWDEPLPSEKLSEWHKWRDSLTKLEQVQIPRPYQSASLSLTEKKEVYVYSDASEKAIAAVAYLVTEFADGTRNSRFLLGKAKVAPKLGHTIPRLELCAAVLAVEISDIVVEQLHITIDDVKFHTDSKVVLGYIHNCKRRFYT